MKLDAARLEPRRRAAAVPADADRPMPDRPTLPADAGHFGTRACDAGRTVFQSQSLPARPVLPPDVPQFVVPVAPVLQPEPRRSQTATSRACTLPLAFTSAIRSSASMTRAMSRCSCRSAMRPLPSTGPRPKSPTCTPSDLERDADQPALFEPLPAAATKPKSYEKWRREFCRWIASTQRLDLLRSDRLAHFVRARTSRSAISASACRPPRARRAMPPRRSSARSTR